MLRGEAGSERSRGNNGKNPNYDDPLSEQVKAIYVALTVFALKSKSKEKG